MLNGSEVARHPRRRPLPRNLPRETETLQPTDAACLPPIRATTLSREGKQADAPFHWPRRSRPPCQGVAVATPGTTIPWDVRGRRSLGTQSLG